MEIWMPIENYEASYLISNIGRVKALSRTVGRRWGTAVLKEKFIKPTFDSRKYLRVGLCRNGKVKPFSIHRLVATAFIPNPDNLPEVNHINGDKNDNTVENLEWCTPLQNTRHAFKTGLIVIPSGAENPHAKPVCQRDSSGKLINIFGSLSGVKEFGFSKHAVGAVCRGDRDLYKGFKWKYI